MTDPAALRCRICLEFVERLSANELAVSIHALAELRVGAEPTTHALRTHESLDQLLSGFLVVYPDQRCAHLCTSVGVA